MRSTTLDDDIATNLQLLDLIDQTDDAHTVPEQTVYGLVDVNQELRRMLSQVGEFSTSSAAERHTAAQARNRDETFRKIGAGSCGAIFAQDGQSVVVKLAKEDSAVLWNDYVKHDAISECFTRYGVDEVRIPECYFFVPKGEAQYFEQHPGLLEAAREVCNLPTRALVTERILPLPQDTRKLLIDKYCSPRNKEAAKSDPANNDCLVRTYLGSMGGRSGGMFFSLRNFKMHLNQMAELKLDIPVIAHRMGISMAVMHWAAKTDAGDVEFALGSSTKQLTVAGDAGKLEPETYTGPPSRRNKDFRRRITQLWLLDFNLVQSITMDEAGVAQAVHAESVNDPYIPKPLRRSPVEKQAWNEFAEAYSTASNIILHEEGFGPDALRLPRLFLQGLVETEKRRQERQAALTD